MDEEIIKKAMEATHWNTESAMPMANKENQLILQTLAELKEKKEQLIEQQQQNEERLQKLQQHSTNAEETLNHNLKLLDAFQSEVRTEAHLHKIALREHSKLKEDLRSVAKDWLNFKKYMDTTENEVGKRTQSIDNMTNRIKWAKTALLEWRHAMEDGNKGFQLIEMYYKDDQLKAKQQNYKRLKLNDDIERHRKRLISMYDDQHTLECNLECAANLYRTTHAERRQMVETWKLAAQKMSQREKDIRNSETALMECRLKVEFNSKELKTHDNQLNEIIENNREVEAAIEILNTETSDMKEQIQRLSDIILLKTREVDLITKELQNLANRVQLQRAQNRHLAKEKANFAIELEHFEVVIGKLETRFIAMNCKNMNAQQRVQTLEELVDVENKAQREVHKETDRINDLIYRSQRQVAQLKEENANLSVNKRGIVSAITAVTKNNQNLEKNLRKQTESNYDLSFKILSLERRMFHLQGGIIDPVVEQKHKDHLRELEERSNQLQKNVQAAQLQNKKLDDDMRKLTIIYNNDMSRLDEVNYKIKEAQAYCEGGMKRIKEETRHNQELIVELSILKMKANEFENEINQCEDGTYNLIKHRMHLNRSIKDRMIELKSQVDLLNLKRKHLLEELSTLRADIGERRKRIEAVKARFELTSKLLGTNEDGTLITGTQLRVETAQEKQMLLDEGNDLNERVLKAEREIEALQNTLALLNNCNDAYRKNLQKQQQCDDATNELKTLQINYCSSLNALRSLRQELQELEIKTEESYKEKEELEKMLHKKVIKRSDNSDFISRLKKELLDQNNKLLRADRELKNALKALKLRAISNEFLELYNSDLDLKELEKRNLNVLNQLGDLAYADDSLGPKIARQILNRNIKMPHMLQKSRSLLSWRSDTSYDGISPSSSRDMFTRSSPSESSELKPTPTSRLSVISLELPVKKNGK